MGLEGQGDDVHSSFAEFVEQSPVPGTPASNRVRVYAKSDGKLYIKDDAGTETDITAAGSGADEDGTYIVQTATNAPANAQILTALSDGIMRVNGTTGVITSLGDTLAVANGGTGATSAGDARTNLGLVIGTDVQAFGAVLDDLNTLGAAASDGEFIVATGAGAFTYESGATVRTSLGLTIGTDVQAFGAVLDDLNTLGAASSDGEFIVATGAGAFAYESGATVRTSLGLGSLATQSTINNGDWSGTDLSVANGGTGLSTFGGTNTLLYTTAADTLASLSTANDGVLITSGTGVPSISSTIPNATQDNITRLGTISSGTWNGTAVAEAYGGTNQTTYATGDLLYASASNTLSKRTVGTLQQVFEVDENGVPVWSDSLLNARTNIALNAFRIAVNGGLSIESMVDGIVDEFEDETGVDTGTSTNEVYDAANDLYTDRQAEAEISGATGTNIGNATAAGGLAAAWDDDEDETAANSAQTSQVAEGFVGKDWGASSTKTLTKVDVISSDDNGFCTDRDTGTITITVQGSTDNFSSSVVDLGSNTGSEGGTSKTTITVSSLTETTAYRYHRIKIENSAGNSTFAIAEVNFYEEAIADMTLQSNSTTAQSTPTTAKIVVFDEEIDSVTLNTDLIAAVSRDGGTTFTNFTLVNEGNYDTDKNILTDTIDISGQPSGTSMKWKVTTANNKEVKIHGVALEWA